MCHKRGVLNTPICGTLPRCGSCSIKANCKGQLRSWHQSTAISAPAAGSRRGSWGWTQRPRELQPSGAAVPWENLFRDVGVSGSTGTQERRGWHRLDARLAGGDTLVVVAIDRIGRRWPDTIRSICELRDLGVKIRSLAETGVGIIGMDSPMVTTGPA